MTNRALTVLSFPALAAALWIAAPAAAQTQCQPGDLFCAELRIGPGQGTVRIGPAQQPLPPPPPVVVQPMPQAQPPVVVVEPEYAPPPPPPAPMPQPPIVVLQPAPPPPPPQVMYRQRPVPMQRVRRVRTDRYPYSSTGLHLHIDGLAGQDVLMGGFGGAFRIRPIPHVALDFGAGLFGGSDYNGLDRVEVPVTADLLVFFNPQHRFQFYGVLGIGGSWSHAEGMNIRIGEPENRDYYHLGGQLGLGVEWRISRVFALNLDVRGFVRQRVDGNETPEFREMDSDGTWMSTDTSGGAVGRFGMTFYFGG